MKSALYDKGDRKIADLEMLNAIPSIVPGRRHETILDQSFNVAGDDSLPVRYDVELSYDGPNGRRHIDHQVLSFETFIGRTYVEEKGTHEIAKTLDDIKTVMTGWANGGLRVITDAELRERNRRWMEDYEERKRSAEEANDSSEDDSHEEAA